MLSFIHELNMHLMDANWAHTIYLELGVFWSNGDKANKMNGHGEDRQIDRYRHALNTLHI